ncbi:hypothetical protein [Micromonospora deserti]|uniref:hypothetical protein n=1 Tax=Micromonospora deserti TaxID=2070366 RepID=UPI0018F3F5C6|nr:hypothetical protein [Micromonospora deserti]
MPASVAADRRNPPLLTVLFWIGVAVAPVAALILLVADGNGPLRFAAVLAILAVVLIGLSIALRPDGGDGPAVAEELQDEIEQLRRELRGEIVAAAQRGNQALDQAQRAQEAVAAVRRRLDASSAALAGAEEPAGAGRARVPAVEPPGEAVSGRGRHPAQDDAPSRWGQDDEEPAHRTQPARYGAERSATGYGADRPAAGSAGVYGTDRSGGVYGARQPEQEARPASEPRPLGVVRHTETVHVTTRHTIVDGAAPVPADSGARYGGGHAGRRSAGPEEGSWAPTDSDDRPWAGYGEPDDRSRRDDNRAWSASPGEERSWSDERDRSGQRWDEWEQRDDRPWADQRDDRGWTGGGEHGWEAPAEQSGRGASYQPDDAGVESGEYWAQLRAGDSWAAVRDDDRGREVRLGERRAEVHADAGGTEYRVADRWAAVRRDEPRRGHDRDGDDAWRGGWVEPESRPALPVGGVPVPDEWRPPRQRGHQEQRAYQPEPEPYGRRQEERYGYPPQDEVPRAGGARSADRWR